MQFISLLPNTSAYTYAHQFMFTCVHVYMCVFMPKCVRKNVSVLAHGVVVAIKYMPHGGESRDVNDRVHGISCQYSDKTRKHAYHFFFLNTQPIFIKKMHIPPNYSNQTFISKLLHNEQ